MRRSAKGNAGAYLGPAGSRGMQQKSAKIHRVQTTDGAALPLHHFTIIACYSFRARFDRNIHRIGT